MSCFTGLLSIFFKLFALCAGQTVLFGVGVGAPWILPHAPDVGFSAWQEVHMR